MITLQEILAQENQIVFVDGSIGDRHDFCWDTYHAHRFEDFNLQRIQEETNEYEKLKRIIEAEGTTTIPEVSKEIRACAEIIGQKVSYHSRPIIPAHKKRRNGNKGNAHFSLSKNAVLNRDALMKMQETIFSTYCSFENNETKINDSRYKSIVDMVKMISQDIGLKKDKASEHGKPARDPNRSDTDERLAAAIFYFSLFDKRTPVLLTADTDFPRLLGIGIQLLGADDFRPYNKVFRKGLKGNRFKLYFSHNGDNYDNRFQQRPLEYCKAFAINGFSAQESEAEREKVLGLWKEVAGAS